MNKQESLAKLQMIEQEASRIGSQIEAIDGQISEFGSVLQSLGGLKGGQKKEMLANIGKGIFARTELKDKELFVNVGKGIVLKKSIEETENIIKEQLLKLSNGKEELMQRISELQVEMNKVIAEAQSQHAHNEQECGHGKK